MIDTRTAPYAALLLRLVLGVSFLIHDGLKVFVFTPAGTAQFFESIGLPGALAYLVMLVELVVGVALILGIQTRIASLAGYVVLLGAIFTVHIHNGYFFSNENGGWEYPAFWAAATIVQALLGSGAYALAAGNKKLATA